MIIRGTITTGHAVFNINWFQASVANTSVVVVANFLFVPNAFTSVTWKGFVVFTIVSAMVCLPTGEAISHIGSSLRIILSNTWCWLGTPQHVWLTPVPSCTEAGARARGTRRTSLGNRASSTTWCRGSRRRCQLPGLRSPHWSHGPSNVQLARCVMR